MSEAVDHEKVTFKNRYGITLGGYAAWGAQDQAAVAQTAAVRCGCASACNVHGHDHAGAWGATLPVSDLKGFWGALGCACWAV
jgi:hypothetical protein